MDWLRNFVDIALPVVVIYWLVFLFLPVVQRMRRVQRELHGLVIPACHLPPKRKDHADL